MLITGFRQVQALIRFCVCVCVFFLIICFICLFFNFHGLMKLIESPSLLKKCPYSELFWSVFSHIRIEYGEIFKPNAGKYGPK